MIFNQLQKFRQTLHDTLGNARDAVFDLMDAERSQCNRLPKVHNPGAFPGIYRRSH
jgi:hypothetical protein